MVSAEDIFFGYESELGHKYHNAVDVIIFLNSIKDRYPAITSLRIIGYSEGSPQYPIYALKITDNPGIQENEPEIQLVGAIHGDEGLSCEIMLKLIEYFVKGYTLQDPVAQYLVNNFELHIIPVLNPYGLTNKTRANANGVDLNRNFGWAYVAGNYAGHYHGTAAFDQSESTAIQNDANTHSYNMSISAHSGDVCFVYLWDYIGTTASGGTPASYTLDDFISKYLPIYTMVKKMADDYAAAVNSYGYYTNFKSVEGYEMFPVYGSLADWMYGMKKALSFTLELHKLKSFNSSNTYLINQVWNVHKQALFSIVKQMLNGLTGIVTSNTGSPLAATIKLEKVSSRAFQDPIEVAHEGYTDPDVGDYHIIADPGTYKVTVSAGGYQDKVIQDVVIPAGGNYRLDVSLSP